MSIEQTAQPELGLPNVVQLQALAMRAAETVLHEIKVPLITNRGEQDGDKSTDNQGDSAGSGDHGGKVFTQLA